MPENGFVVAMAAEVELARYGCPSKVLRRVGQWMIISRLAADGGVLTISNAGSIALGGIHVPIGLRPIRTMVGILMSDDGTDAFFLLVRHLPPPLEVAGTFFPADGYARVTGPIESLRLTVAGRHAHSCGWRDGGPVRHDVADPAPGARGALAWHVNAVRRPWKGEFPPRRASVAPD